MSVCPLKFNCISFFKYIYFIIKTIEQQKNANQQEIGIVESLQAEIEKLNQEVSKFKKKERKT